MQHGIDVGHLQPVAQVVAHVVGIVRIEVRLAGVEPPDLGCRAVVVVAHLLPDKVAGFRVGRVIELYVDPSLRAGVAERLMRGQASLVADEQPALPHLVIVLAVRVHGRPDGDHELDAHLFQLTHHACRIGPGLGIELPVALQCPVEVVADDDRERQTAPLVLTRDVEQLVLRAIAQLALPESRGPLGKLGA